jgi:hypothetical protein
VQTKTRYVKYKNRYLDMAPARKGKKKRAYLRFEEYKHSVRFSTQESLMDEGYIERDLRNRRRPDFNGHYVQEYMKAFNLWTPREALTLIQFAMGGVEGVRLADYGKNDNKADALYQAVVDRGDFIVEHHLPEGKPNKTYKHLIKYGSKATADRFRMYHNYLDEYFTSKGLWDRGKELIKGPKAFKLEYRRYLMKRLSGKYRETKQRITIGDIDKVTEDFIKDHDGILEDLVRRGYTALEQTADLADRFFKWVGFADIKPKREVGKRTPLP